MVRIKYWPIFFLTWQAKKENNLEWPEDSRKKAKVKRVLRETIPKGHWKERKQIFDIIKEERK